MPNTPSLDFNVIDGTALVTPAAGDINAVLVETKRGPYGKASDVITNFEAFKRLYGGLDESLPGIYQVKRALDGGSKLRIVKVGELSSGNPTATKAAAATPIIDASTAPVELFQLVPKYAGAAYNDIVVSILPASNGGPNYFNLAITFKDDGEDYSELYSNLIVPGAPTAAESDYLSKVVTDSKLVDVVYLDASSADDPSRPVDATIAYAGGTNGAAVDSADFEGSLKYLDNYDDFTYVAGLPLSDNSFLIALAAYCTNRKDCIGMGYIGSGDDVDALVAARQATNVDSPLMSFFTGLITISNPITGTANATIDIPILGDALAAQGLTAAEEGPWISFVGQDRGTIFAQAVVDNRGTKGKKDELEKLANAQINTVVNRSGRIMLWHGFSAQLVESVRSFLSIVELTLYISKSLTPTVERYIEKPLDFVLVRQLYKEVKPFLDGLTTASARALFTYTWQGDQTATTLDGLVINDPTDFTQGKYKVNLFITPIAPLQQVEINLILTRDGVEIA